MLLSVRMVQRDEHEDFVYFIIKIQKCFYELLRIVEERAMLFFEKTII